MTKRKTVDERATHTPKLSFSVRFDAAHVAWLSTQARDNGTSISVEIRRLVDEAMEEDS